MNHRTATPVSHRSPTHRGSCQPSQTWSGKHADRGPLLQQSPPPCGARSTQSAGPVLPPQGRAAVTTFADYAQVMGIAVLQSTGSASASVCVASNPDLRLGRAEIAEPSDVELLQLNDIIRS